jgi:cytochrome b pre-mRNA-processing protein 3
MYFGSKQKRRDREIADGLYTCIVDASRQPAFFVEFAVPDTLDGRFEMLSLHMFIALNGLVDRNDQDKKLARSIMELFVRDMDAALREIGVSDIKVPKRMKALYGSFGGRIAGYTLAVAEGGEALCAALARNVYVDGGEPGNVVDLGAYVNAALDCLRRAGSVDLREGQIRFPDPLAFRSGNDRSEQAFAGASDG